MMKKKPSWNIIIVSTCFIFGYIYAPNNRYLEIQFQANVGSFETLEPNQI
eukprot:UN07943